MEMLTQTLDWHPAAPKQEVPAPDILRVGKAVVHRRTGQVESPAGRRRLRAKELQLLMLLFENVTMTFSRSELLQLVWNYRPGLMTRTVDQTVATLRKKIESDPNRPRVLQTVYGIGYRLVL